VTVRARSGRRFPAVLVALLLAVLGSFALAPPAAACSCTRPTEDRALFDEAAVVFLGTVVDDRSRGRTRTLTFAVERVFKGAATSLQQVRTDVSTASCGLGLEGTGPFLVQADDTGRSLVADLCGGTRPAMRSAATGGGYAPLPGGGPPSDGTAWEEVGTALAFVLGGLVVGAAVVVARRRSGRPER
jgi:hypothetical protein